MKIVEFDHDVDWTSKRVTLEITGDEAVKLYAGLMNMSGIEYKNTASKFGVEIVSLNTDQLHPQIKVLQEAINILRGE